MSIYFSNFFLRNDNKKKRIIELKRFESKRRALFPVVCQGAIAQISLLLIAFQFFGQHGDDFKQVAHDTVIGFFENRGLRVFVDSNDDF